MAIVKHFKVGDAVTWVSSSAGSTTRKTGRVVAVLPAGMNPTRAIEPFRRSHTIKWGGGTARDHVSYLVEVPGASARAKPSLYWPVVNYLVVP